MFSLRSGVIIGFVTVSVAGFLYKKGYFEIKKPLVLTGDDKIDVTKARLAKIESALETFKKKYGNYPLSVSEVFTDRTLGLDKEDYFDGWGDPVQYIRKDYLYGYYTKYDLFSLTLEINPA